MYTVTKRYGHERGLSCCFRQWAATSHCRFLHGYALAVELTFESPTLDERNWVIDFGCLKPVKDWLEETFDHNLILANDDPAFEALWALGAYTTHRHTSKLARVVTMPAVGCEAFAGHIATWVIDWLDREIFADRVGAGVRLRSVKVSEHAGNSASWERDRC